MIDLLGGCGASSGGVDVENDGLYGGVFAELAELGVDFFRIEDDAIDVDDCDFIGAESDGG